MLNTSRIKELREKAGLSQQAAAEKAGLGTRQRWNQIENGNAGAVTLDTLAKIAKALGVKPKDLLN